MCTVLPEFSVSDFIILHLKLFTAHLEKLFDSSWFADCHYNLVRMNMFQCLGGNVICTKTKNSIEIITKHMQGVIRMPLTEVPCKSIVKSILGQPNIMSMIPLKPLHIKWQCGAGSFFHNQKKTWESSVFRKWCDCTIFFQVSWVECLYCKINLYHFSISILFFPFLC